MSGAQPAAKTMSLLADYNMPFAAALVLMVLLALLQVVGLGHVFGDHDIDADADSDGGLADGLLSFLGIGRVPFMVWLASFLLMFAALGVGIQALADGLLGAPLDRWLAAALAAVAALPVTGVLVRPLAAILPGDETSAVGLDSLVGRRAQIVTGRAAAGHPARAQVQDHFGHAALRDGRAARGGFGDARGRRAAARPPRERDILWRCLAGAPAGAAVASAKGDERCSRQPDGHRDLGGRSASSRC